MERDGTIQIFYSDDIDIEQSIAAHCLPVFTGVTLCISGITNIIRRAQINKLIPGGGGTYVKALERPTDKMRYVDNFNRTGEADPPIQLVWDCLEFGGRFNEARYQVQLPWLERRAMEAHSPHNANANSQLPHPRAPPATTYEDDDDGDEFAPVKQHLPDVTLQLWGNLLKARGYEVASGGVMLSPGKARQMAVQERAAAGDELPEGGSRSVLSSFRRANSYVAPRMLREPSSAGAGPSRLPFGHSGSVNGNSTANGAGTSSSHAKRLGEGDATQTTDDAATAPAPNAAPADEPSTVFAGFKFLLRGETDTAPVRGAIEGVGVIVRLVSGSALYLAEPSSVACARYRTECWLECCLFADYLCAPSTHVSFVPLGVSLPVPGADRITLSFSGLDTSEACWVRRLLKALGAKYVRGRQWGVPVVDMGWLAAMAQHGAVPDMQAFLVLPSDATGEAELDVPAEGRKGKVKEKAEMMQDITNSYDSQDSQPKQEVFFLPPPPLARPSFGNPGPAGVPAAHRHPGEARCGADAFDAQPAKAAPVDGHASSSSSSSAHPGPCSGTGASAVRCAATFSAALRVTSSLPARVPSSASPSSLHRGVSVSLPKISDERTKALQESITSLLGKLPAVPEDDAPALGRAGKRDIAVVNSAWQPSGASSPLRILAYTLSRAA
ncbi:hypothetical protein DFH09DRAFT_1458075 [Mycena vulgaris]|nr:hypothetical protein DFH09DRAFT_1458075 [Mycena vulgaris]